MHKHRLLTQEQKKPPNRIPVKPTRAMETPTILTLSNSAFQRMLPHLQQQTLQRAEGKKPPSAIGYMGLNPEANKEADALKAKTPDQVIVSLNDKEKQASLKERSGKMKFIRLLFDNDPKFQGKLSLALACLEQCDPAFCDQMAGMMTMFCNAENGKYQLERIVLSGHHYLGKDDMWGDVEDTHEPGHLFINKDLPNLVKVFPTAAAQVKEIMFSACNSKNFVVTCAKLFPSLKSVWVYEGSSPKIEQGSAKHITSWESKTRGDKDLSLGDSKGNIVIWTREKGFSDAPKKTK